MALASFESDFRSEIISWWPMKRWLEVLIHIAFWCFTTWVIYLAFGESDYELINVEGVLTTMVHRNIKELWFFALTHIFKAALFYTNVFVLFPRYLKNRKLRSFILTSLAVLVTALALELIISNYLMLGTDGLWVYITPRLPLSFTLSIFYLGMSFAYSFALSWMKNERQKSVLVQEKLVTELAFLKAQVNPHFLFNTLNNLYSMANRSDTPELADGIDKLSQLMRYMLHDSNSETVPLDRELDYIRSFIEIQKLRLSEDDDFIIQFNVDGPTGNVRIAPMLLIPFVENAFKHGIDIKESSVIKIELIIANDEMIFSVFNSCADNVNSLEKGKSGIGLENLRRRLELLYYERYSLEIKEDGEVHGAILKLNLN